MKNQQKINKKVFSVISVILMLAVGFSFFSLQNDDTLKAYADDFDTIYYFSDNADSASYCAQLVNNSIIDNVVRRYVSGGENSYKTYLLNQGNMALYGIIENQYVIFEVSNDYFYDIQNGQKVAEVWGTYSSFGAFLDDIFSTMKDNGCKIMFICSIEEALWKNQSSFLDNVDMHVSCGTDRDFLSTILTKAAIDCDNAKINNCTFILGPGLAEGITDGYLDNYFTREYFMKYIRTVYQEEILAFDDPLSAEANHAILVENNIKLLFQINSTIWYDAVNFQPIGLWNTNNLLDFYEEYIENDYVYVYNQSMSNLEYDQQINDDEDALEHWIDYINDRFSEMGNQSMPIKINNRHGYPLANVRYPNVKIVEKDSTLIYNAILAFLSLEDLSIFDNWDGLCGITYKAFGIGPDGWLYNPDDVTIDGFNFGEIFDEFAIDAEDPLYNYYYGYNDKLGAA